MIMFTRFVYMPASVPLEFRHTSPLEFGGWRKCCGGTRDKRLIAAWWCDDPKPLRLWRCSCSALNSTKNSSCLLIVLDLYMRRNCFILPSPKVLWVWKDTSKQLKAIFHSEDNSEFYMFLYILKRINIKTRSYGTLCGIYSSLMEFCIPCCSLSCFYSSSLES